MKNRNLYVIVGAQRSGTTYLAKILDEHPEICLAKPVKPEPKFFLSNEFELGKDYYINKYFFGVNKTIKSIVEKSTSYYENEIVAERIKNLFSNAKIIFLLRNPIYRALSNYFFSKNNGIETRSLEEVFIKKKKAPEYSAKISTNPFNYLQRGEYAKYIEMYLKYFDNKNIKILFFNDIIANLEKIKELYNFLQVDSDYVPLSINKKINKTEKDESVDEEIINVIANYYKQHNERLKTILNINELKW